MQLTIYKNFSKKKNSTKRPSGGRVVNVVMKENTSVESPTFLIDGIDLDANYCKAFGHYYYIDDIVLNNNNIYELVCSQDVLATHKDEIGSNWLFVERSYSEKDEYLIDGLATPSTDETYDLNSVIFYDGTPSYVLGFLSQSEIAGRQGATSYVEVSQTKLNTLISNLFDETDNSPLENSTNPLQYISSCMYFPFTPQGTSLTNAIKIGYWEAIGAGQAYTATSKHYESKTLTIPKHPQITDDTKWLYKRPYSRYTLRVEPFGSIELDNDIMFADESFDDSLLLEMWTDCITGKAVLTVKCNTRIICRVYGNVGVPIQLAQRTGATIGDIAGTVTGAIATVGNAAIGNYVGAAATGLTTVVNAIESHIPKLNVSGVNGSLLSFTYSATIEATFTEVKLPNYIQVGYPLCQTKYIDNLSGYIKCAGASVDVAGLGNDAEEINNYLNNGFFYE